MRAVHLEFVAGLTAGLLESGVMPWLSGHLRRQAGLVCSFPQLPETLEETVRRNLTRLPDDRLRCRRDDRLLEAARQYGLSSAERKEAARALDDRLRERSLESGPELVRLIVAGPGLRPVDETIEVPCLPRSAHWWVRSSLLFVGPSPSGETPSTAEVESWCEKLLAHRGVERVLHGELLDAWSKSGGLSSPPAPFDRLLLVAVARSGFSFEREKASVGHPEVAPEEQGLLLQYQPDRSQSDGENEDWPAQLHDYRIAVSILRHLGLGTAKSSISPFPF